MDNGPLIVRIRTASFSQDENGIGPAMCDVRGGNVSRTSYVVYIDRLAHRAIVGRCRRSPTGYFTVRGTMCPLRSSLRRVMSRHGPCTRHGRGIIAFLKHVAVRGKPRCFVRTTGQILSHARGMHFYFTNDNSVVGSVVRVTTTCKVTSHYRFPNFVGNGRIFRYFHSDSMCIVPSMSRPFNVSPLRTVRDNIPSVVDGRSNYTRVLAGYVGISC